MCMRTISETRCVCSLDSLSRRQIDFRHLATDLGVPLVADANHLDAAYHFDAGGHGAQLGDVVEEDAEHELERLLLFHRGYRNHHQGVHPGETFRVPDGIAHRLVADHVQHLGQELRHQPGIHEDLETDDWVLAEQDAFQLRGDAFEAPLPDGDPVRTS